MKKYSMLLILTLIANICNLSAEKICYDGIWYEIIDSVNHLAWVSFKGDDPTQYENEYSGVVIIPETFIHTDGFEYTVTGMLSYAFSYCSELESVTIPNSVTNIGCFCGCTKLTSVTLPENIRTIPSRCFSDCIGLTNIKIPNKVEQIGGQAFMNCISLKSITIPKSVIQLGNEFQGNIENESVSVSNLFFGCSSLESIVVESGNEKFDSRNNCNAIIETATNRLLEGCNSTIIPEGTTKIGYSAFSGRSNLTNIIIPNSVTCIDNAAFSGCIGLKKIHLPEELKSIGEGAFYGCDSLSEINIPNSVTIIGRRAFPLHLGDWDGHALYIDNCLVYTTTQYFDGDYIIRNGTRLIADYAFNVFDSYDNEITGITIPNSVTKIGKFAFHNCRSLIHINIPDAILNIEDYTFYNCTSLSSIIIPNSVTSIGNGAFENCTSLSSINIPDSVTSIGGGAFQNCTSLSSINIPNSVTSIGNGAFYNCTSLSSINIPNSVTSIGGGAFSYTPLYYDESNWENGVLYYDNCLLEAKKDITGNCSIKEEIRLIASSSFYQCKKLTSVSIPKSITTISPYVFRFCTSLKSVYIPNSVTRIENYAFSNCFNLINISIPSSVTYIGRQAFSFCNIKNITLNSPTYIEESCFINNGDTSYNAHCSPIQTITCTSLPPTVHQYLNRGYNSFDGCLSDTATIIYVPYQYLEDYQTHDFWGKYDVRPLSAKPTDTDSIQVMPDENSAYIVWPIIIGAVTYELIIRDQQENTICTLTFNKQGQLIQIAFYAPAKDTNRNQIPKQTQTEGFSFTITGLEQNMTYDYTLTSKDSNGNVIDVKSGSFTTNSSTGIENIEELIMPSDKPTKILKDGEVYILTPDGRVFNLQGIEL